MARHPVLATIDTETRVRDRLFTAIRGEAASIDATPEVRAACREACEAFRACFERVK